MKMSGSSEDMANHSLKPQIVTNSAIDQLRKHSFIYDGQFLEVLDCNARGTQPYCRYKRYGQISALSDNNLLLKSHDMARIYMFPTALNLWGKNPG